MAALVHSVVGHEVSAHVPLMQAGLDSLGAVELRNALSLKFGADLPPTITLDYPSVAALAAYLAPLTAAAAAAAAEGALLESWSSAELSSFGSEAEAPVAIGITATSCALPQSAMGCAEDAISGKPLWLCAARAISLSCLPVFWADCLKLPAPSSPFTIAACSGAAEPVGRGRLCRGLAQRGGAALRRLCPRRRAV